ncbi:HNH endonuclease [Ottowia sp.]|uniref:HNH endonuclease n=1 Tax=Ottowia sp. TaxID=1898956 RepID=UPI003C727E6F
MVLLHRWVMKCNDPLVLVDHANGDKLDNTRANLRLCTRSQNAYNNLKKPGLSSQFRGVTWHRKIRKWQATIAANGRPIYLGCFDDEHEAGHAYNKAAVELHGEFCRLNPVGRPS